MLASNSGTAPARGKAIVIGAGIAGVSIGRQLAKEGWSVIIMEKAIPGQGTTKAAFGALTPYSDQSLNPEGTREFVRRSVDLYPSWLKELERESGLQIDYDASGLLEVAFTAEKFQSLEGAYESFSRSGYDVRLIDQDDFLSLEPNASREIVGALRLPEPCVDTTQLFSACLKSAEKVGCRFLREEVDDIILTGNRVSGVRLAGGETKSADLVVVSTGAELPTVGEQSVPCALRKSRGESIEVQATPGYLRHQLYGGKGKVIPGLSDGMDGFITPRRDGRLLLGASYLEDDESDVNPNSISVLLALMTLHANLDLVPGILNLQITRIWKGWRVRSADSQPIIGASEIGGLYWAMGLFGLGVTMAPIAAFTISNLVMNRETFLPRQVAPARFGL